MVIPLLLQIVCQSSKSLSGFVDFYYCITFRARHIAVIKCSAFAIFIHFMHVPGFVIGEFAVAFRAFSLLNCVSVFQYFHLLYLLMVIPLLLQILCHNPIPTFSIQLSRIPRQFRMLGKLQLVIPRLDDFHVDFFPLLNVWVELRSPLVIVGNGFVLGVDEQVDRVIPGILPIGNREFNIREIYPLGLIQTPPDHSPVNAFGDTIVLAPLAIDQLLYVLNHFFLGIEVCQKVVGTILPVGGIHPILFIIIVVVEMWAAFFATPRTKGTTPTEY